MAEEKAGGAPGGRGVTWKSLLKPDGGGISSEGRWCWGGSYSPG